MNIKQKLEKAKQKIKFYAPEIISVATAVAGVGIYIYRLSQQNVFTDAEDNGFQLKEVDEETRKMMMEGEDFKLLELTEDEYMLVRKSAE